MHDAIIKLKNLKSKIETMPDNYQKTLLVTNYFRLYTFLTDSGLIKDDDIEYFLETNVDDFIRKQCKDNINYINDLTRNNKRLLEICMELRDVYLTGNWNKRRAKRKISKNKANKLLESFFKTLGNDIYTLYNELRENNVCQLSVSIQDADGACYGMNGEKYSYINVNNNDNNLDGYIALVHEIGHAYHFYLTRNHGKVTLFDINMEVMSLLFEKLFVKFMESSYDYQLEDNSIWYDYYHSHFWILMDTLVTSKLLNENKIYYIDHALNCKSSFNDFELLAFSEDLGYITDTVPELSLDGYYYIIGNIISDYFMKRMELNFQDGFREVCNFVQEASYYTVREILDKYAINLSYTKDSIRNTIRRDRSYLKRR